MRDVILYAGLPDPEDEGSTMLRNEKNCLTNVTASYTRRLKTSAALLRAPELSHLKKCSYEITWRHIISNNTGIP